MHIQKVLNSSVVLVQDDSGEESILLGKGIGYGRKAGEPIERQPSDRVFLPLSNPDAQPMLELFSSIPASCLTWRPWPRAWAPACRWAPA